MNRVALVAGARTPFVKSGKALKEFGPLSLARHATIGLLEKHDIDPAMIDALAFGVVVGEPKRPNLAREIVLEEEKLPGQVEAQTFSSYCITGLRTITAIAEGIATGRIGVGIAGGTESLSRATADTFLEPSTGVSMGDNGEIIRRQWDIPRQSQDKLALASHENALAARDKLAKEIVPLAGMEHDSGPRAGSSLEKLAKLRPVFDPEGTITAGNASPVTDGASAVLLMSEERAKTEGLEPLAFIRAMEFAAIPMSDGMLMAPALAVPRLLEKTGLSLEEIDLVEIHEAFAAQVLANVKAWEEGWKGKATGSLDWSRVNVNGSSLAIGHPWSATGGRIVTTLANEMARRNARYGLVSICAAGAMAGAFLLERS